MLNRYNNNFQLVFTPIKNDLYILQTLYIPYMAAITQNSIFTFFKFQHERLSHLNYANLKYFSNTKERDMSKMNVDKNILFYKISIKAKEKGRFLYKIQYLLENICEKLHINLIGSIILIRWNKYKDFLTITDGYSRYQQVKNIYAKYEARLYLKQFITFIKKQIRKNIKYPHLD